MANTTKRALLIILIAALVVISLWHYDLGRGVTLENIQQSAADLKEQAQAHYIISVILYICTYIVLNLWLPAAAVLTILAGYIFGVIPGAIYSDIATTLNAALAFIAGRSFAGNWIHDKWEKQLRSFNDHLDKHGYLYLLLVRLVPVMPFCIQNLVAGLTKIRFRTFIWTTAVGALPGIVILCYAGRELFSLRSVNDIFTTKVIVSIALLAALVVLIAAFKIIRPRIINHYQAANHS